MLSPMTAAMKLKPSADPVSAPMPDRPLSAEQRAEVERALLGIAEGRIPPLSSENVRRAIEERLRAEQEALQAGDDDLTPEEFDELERGAAQTDEDFRAGRLLTWEQFLERRAVRRAG